MRKVPLYRRIVFKILVLFILILSVGFSISFIITTKNIDKRIEQNLVDKFDSSLHTTENFISLISEVSQMWAKEIIYDHLFYKNIKSKEIVALSDVIKTHKLRISADAIILLDKNGIVVAEEGSVHTSGDSLAYYDIIKDTIKTKTSVSKIAREKENFILYSSACIKKIMKYRESFL